ncbi:MAG: transglycosylase domain-containing protein, partial [Caldilineaceae bacterium]
MARTLLLAVMAVALLGCTSAGLPAPREISIPKISIPDSITVQVPREAVDIAAKIERTLASDQVTDLTENLDDYLAEYAARYAVSPRRSDKPLEIAESYLRDYQPGPQPRVFQTTIIYDRTGVRLAEIFDEGKRTWVSLDQISPHLIDAVIATEDSSFYANPGIDPRR